MERENTQELIGILQAISIVAKSLAVKLMQIEKSVQAYESGAAAVAGRRGLPWGWSCSCAVMRCGCSGRPRKGWLRRSLLPQSMGSG